MEADVATVNFSVPDEVKDASNRTFAKKNKSAIIANLIAPAVEEEQRRKKRAKAIQSLLARRETKKPITEQQFRAAREEFP